MMLTRAAHCRSISCARATVGTCAPRPIVVTLTRAQFEGDPLLHRLRSLYRRPAHRGVLVSAGFHPLYQDQDLPEALPLCPAEGSRSVHCSPHAADRVSTTRGRRSKLRRYAHPFPLILSSAHLWSNRSASSAFSSTATSNTSMMMSNSLSSSRCTPPTTSPRCTLLYIAN